MYRWEGEEELHARLKPGQAETLVSVEGETWLLREALRDSHLLRLTAAHAELQRVYISNATINSVLRMMEDDEGDDDDDDDEGEEDG